MERDVKHIDLDQDEHVKRFVLSLELDPDGSLLEVNGEPVARMLPVGASDREKLKEAILSRRDESRALNAQWENADREVWDKGIPKDD
jgi:hypothetical protein